MDAGQLNNRITIQQQSTSVDALGQPVATWSDVALVWADVKFQSGSESIKAGAQVATSKCSIRIRYRTGLTSAMRVLLGSTVLQILAVLPDEKGRKHVDLACEVLA